jgi:hypothetical protein
MTAKHAVYLAIKSGSINLTELQAKHRSLQVRRVGKSDALIRFKDSEPWMNLKDWSENYRNGCLKQLADLVTANLQVFPPEEILSLLPEETQSYLAKHLSIMAFTKEDVVPKEKYIELTLQYNQLVDEWNKVQKELEACLAEEDERNTKRSGCIREARKDSLFSPKRNS